MLKKIVVICLVFYIQGCKPQNQDQKETEKIKHYEVNNNLQYNNLVTSKFETFDIKRFDKNKDEAEDYVYALEDGTRIREFGYEGRGYFSEVVPKKSLFTISKGFYPIARICNPCPHSTSTS